MEPKSKPDTESPCQPSFSPWCPRLPSPCFLSQPSPSMRPHKRAASLKTMPATRQSFTMVALTMSQERAPAVMHHAPGDWAPAHFCLSAGPGVTFSQSTGLRSARFDYSSRKPLARVMLQLHQSPLSQVAGVFHDRASTKSIRPSWTLILQPPAARWVLWHLEGNGDPAHFTNFRPTLSQLI